MLVKILSCKQYFQLKRKCSTGKFSSPENSQLKGKLSLKNCPHRKNYQFRRTLTTQEKNTNLGEAYWQKEK